MKRSKVRCSDCTSTALYGFHFPMACERHRTDAMVNLVERRCVSCNLMEIVDTEGRCGTCSPQLFRKVRLAKQRTVQAWLDAAGMTYQLTDRALTDARPCGVYARPDFLFDAGSHAVVLEVDEHQHVAYECERKRMVDIASTIGMCTVFVRFNPDAYKPAPGIRGRPSMQTRRDTLLKVLRHHMEELRVSEEDIARSQTGAWVVRLFYDGDDPRRYVEPESCAL